jgi:hypothetical protein
VAGDGVACLLDFARNFAAMLWQEQLILAGLLPAQKSRS